MEAFVFQIFELIFWTLAVLVLGVAGIIALMHRRKISLCSLKTTGTVVGYTVALRSDLHLPIVRYYADGFMYSKALSVGLVTSVSTPLSNGEILSISENGNIRINKNSFVNRTDLMAKYFPVNSTVPVFYNNLNPRQAFVGYKPKEYMSIILAAVGAFFALIAIAALLIHFV